MIHRHIWMTYSISAICLLLAGQHASAAFFVPLGHLRSEDSASLATDISADGSVVVGFSGHIGWFGVDGEAFGWTSDGGMVGLGYLPGADSSWANAVSADGSVVVGSGAFRWTQLGGMVGIGDGTASAVSADGSVVAVNRVIGGEVAGFRWTPQGGMVGLGDLPGGLVRSGVGGISADGSLVVGNSYSASGPEAFRWTSEGGMVGLGDLPGGGFRSGAEGVSSDGSVVVGFSNSADGEEAFRWTSEEGMVGLGDLPGGIHQSSALDVSADGAVVVGYSASAIGQQEAFVWDATHGMRSLSAVLTGQGVDLTGWRLTLANAISADGTTIVGVGANPLGQTEAWLANISRVPEPTTCMLFYLAIATLAAGSRAGLRATKLRHVVGIA